MNVPFAQIWRYSPDRVKLGMNAIPTIIMERIDDVPLLREQMQRIGVPMLLNTPFFTHGNWTGLSLDWVSTTWLSSIVSQG